MALVDKGAALCIEEKELTAESLWEALCQLMDTPDKLRRMGECARGCAILDASERIYAVIEEVLQNR